MFNISVTLHLWATIFFSFIYDISYLNNYFSTKREIYQQYIITITWLMSILLSVLYSSCLSLYLEIWQGLSYIWHFLLSYCKVPFDLGLIFKMTDGNLFNCFNYIWFKLFQIDSNERFYSKNANNNIKVFCNIWINYWTLCTLKYKIFKSRFLEIDLFITRLYIFLLVFK